MAWMDTIKRLFSKTGRSDAGVEGVRVILAADNPYGVDLWDCATFTQSMISTTSDPGVAAQFARLRAATGNELLKMVPGTIDCQYQGLLVHFS